MTHKTLLSDLSASLQTLPVRETLFICGGGFNKHNFMQIVPTLSITPVGITDVIVDYGVLMENK